MTDYISEFLKFKFRSGKSTRAHYYRYTIFYLQYYLDHRKKLWKNLSTDMLLNFFLWRYSGKERSTFLKEYSIISGFINFLTGVKKVLKPGIMPTRKDASSVITFAQSYGKKNHSSGRV